MRGRLLMGFAAACMALAPLPALSGPAMVDGPPTAAQYDADDDPDTALTAATRAMRDGDYPLALQIARPQVERLSTERPADDPTLLSAREIVVYSQAMMGEPVDAIGALRQILEIREARRPDHVVTLRTAHHLATLHFRAVDMAEAIEIWEACHSRIEGGVEGPADEVGALRRVVERDLAQAWFTFDAFERGTAIMEAQIARLTETYGADHFEPLRARWELARYITDYGDGTEAIDELQQLSEIAETSLGPHTKLGVYIRITLAQALVEGRDYSEAIAVLRDLARVVDPDRYPTPLVLELYEELTRKLYLVGDERWKTWLERAIALATEKLGPDAPRLAEFYVIYLGNVAFQPVANEARFEHMAAEAVRIRRRSFGPDHSLTIDAELAQVRLFVGGDRTAEARALLDDVLERADGIGDTTVVRLQGRLADVLFREEDFEGALEVRRSMARQIDLLPEAVVGVYDILNELYMAWTLLRLDRTDEARERIESAKRALEVELLDHLSRNGEEALLHLLHQWDSAEHLMLSIREEPKFDLDNWRELLLWRGFGARLLTHRAARTRRQPRLARIETRRSTLRRAIADRLAMMAREVGSTASSPGGDALEDLRAELAQVEAELLEALGAPPTPRELAPPIAAVCEAMPPQARLVHIVSWLSLREGPYSTRSYDAFVLDGEDCSVTRVPLGPRKDVDRAMHRWRRAVQAVGMDPGLTDKLGSELSTRLLGPLEPHLRGAQRVIFVPDGALSLVAWAGLPHPDGGYMVEHHELTVLQDVAELTQPRSRRRRRARSLLVGGVDYGAPASAPPGEAGEDRGSCITGRFQPLPGTEAELEAIEALAPGRPERLEGSEATPAAVREAMPDATHVHLATHGFFLNRRCLAASDASVDAALDGTPLARSGLALAGANLGARAEGDGLLMAAELMDLDLSRTELVVLSACDTGRGEQVDGQGVLGLRWALGIAGARAQVFSLWPVPDAETSSLMADFYDGLGAGDRCVDCDPVHALRFSQLRALAKQRAEGRIDVKTWAGFQVSAP